MPSVTVSLTGEVEVDFYEDRSGLSEEEFAKRVVNYVDQEREEIAGAMRIVAIKLLNGEPL